MVMNINNAITEKTSKLLFQRLDLNGYENMTPYPKAGNIISIIDRTRAAMFPEYFGELPASVSPAIWLQSLLSEIHRDLINEIETALCKQADNSGHSVSGASDISAYLIDHLADIRKLLLRDAQAGFNGDPAAQSVDEVILTYPGFFAVFVHRIAHLLFLKRTPFVPRMMSEYAHSITGIDIHPGAEIGEYFFIDHGTGVVIGETAAIGNHVKLYQGVTIGALSTQKGQGLKNVKRHPTIEDNVTIYSGASILGGDTVICEGAVIGSNAFIVKSVPSKTVVRMPGSAE